MALNDVMHFGGELSLSGSNGHAPLKHAGRTGAIEPQVDLQCILQPHNKSVRLRVLQP